MNKNWTRIIHNNLFVSKHYLNDYVAYSIGIFFKQFQNEKVLQKISYESASLTVDKIKKPAI